MNNNKNNNGKNNSDNKNNNNYNNNDADNYNDINNVKNEYIIEKKSGIHNTGIFAKRFILKGTKIIEYVGEKISKKESEKRSDEVLEESKNNKEKGAVYIFELNKKYDLDGNVPYNTARFINHSCDPNCESELDEDHIWIIALRDILEGEELTYNYGYDTDNFEEHPCICGSENCIGYIVNEEKWSKLKKEVKKNYKNQKVLVAYYSRTGNTKKVAKFLADYFEFDLDEIRTDNREGIVGYIKSGYESACNKNPEVFFYKNPEDYDLVIIGTPIWANTISSPVRSYLKYCKHVNVSAFSTRGGQNVGKTFKEISLSVSSFKGMTHLNAKDIKNNKYQYEVLKFFKDLNS